MKWHYEYDETGGYDCMYGSFNIYRESKAITKIDQSDFGQKPCDYKRFVEAQKWAEFIVNACNQAEVEL